MVSAMTFLALEALCPLSANADVRATALAAQDPTPGASRLPSRDEGGYATTYFTPPWNTTEALTIFATSSTQVGNLGGLEGARALCQNLANAVPTLTGTTWYPLLSDSTYDASTLTGASPSSAPIYNVDGSVIAANRSALWSGGALQTGVKGTETGAIRYDSVFTGTSASGARTLAHCGNWTSTSGNGTIGATNDTSTSWIGGFITSCAVSYRLFCIGNYDPHRGAPYPTPTFTATRTPTPTVISTLTPSPTNTSTVTPTPLTSPVSPTNSPTPTTPPLGSPSPTPSVASVMVQVLIGSTPVPALPVRIGGATVNTDHNGSASTRVPSSAFVTIETGLPAVAFTPFSGVAGSFHERTMIINATRLVVPNPEICSVTIRAIPHLWFPYSNIGGSAFSIPLSLYRLNRILSPSGFAAPAGLFAPGERGNGYALPRSHFESGASLSGSWEFLATSVSVPPSPLPCADTGAPPTTTPVPSCVPVDLSVLITETKRTITTLSNESLKAAARGEWKPQGNMREPFLKGGAQALKKMRSAIQGMGKTPLVCATPPTIARCSTRTLNKATLKKNFGSIVPSSLPPGLGRVKRLIPGVKARFARIVDSLPSTLYTCP